MHKKLQNTKKFVSTQFLTPRSAMYRLGCHSWLACTSWGYLLKVKTTKAWGLGCISCWRSCWGWDTTGTTVSCFPTPSSCFQELMHSGLARQPLLAPTVLLPPKAVCPPCHYKPGISASFDDISAGEESLSVSTQGLLMSATLLKLKYTHLWDVWYFHTLLSAIELSHLFSPNWKKKQPNQFSKYMQATTIKNNSNLNPCS